MVKVPVHTVLEKVLPLRAYLVWAVVFLLLAKFTFSNIAALGSCITSEVPFETREPVTMILVDGILKGHSIYDNEYQPEYTYVYGPLYPYVCAVVSAIFGNDLTTHRGVSVFFIAGSCFLLFLLMQNSKIKKRWCFFGLFVFLFYLTISTNCLVRPGAMGLFFLLLSILVPYACNYSVKSLIACGVIGFLAMLSKQYFLIGAPTVFLYVALFVCLKRGVISAALFFIAVFLFILFHYYCNNAFLTNFIYSIINDSSKDWNHMIAHLKDVIVYHFGLIALFCIGFWAKPLGGKASHHGFLDINFSLSNFLLIIFFIVIILKLGPHIGNDYLYYFHLFTPFLIWAAFDNLPEFFENNDGVMAIFLFLICYIMHYHLVPMRYRFNHDHSEGWKELDRICSAHRDVLLHRYGASFITKYGFDIVDSGNSQYSLIASLDNNQCKGSNRYREVVSQKRELTRNKILNKEYDLIITDDKYRVAMASTDLIKKHYHYVGELEVGYVFNGMRTLFLLKPNVSQ